MTMWTPSLLLDPAALLLAGFGQQVPEDGRQI
jgi:hypothetical protein